MILLLIPLQTSLTIADGILTPAVSVTSAVGGIAIAKPNVINDITGISIVSLAESGSLHQHLMGMASA